MRIPFCPPSVLTAPAAGSRNGNRTPTLISAGVLVVVLSSHGPPAGDRGLLPASFATDSPWSASCEWSAADTTGGRDGGPGRSATPDSRLAHVYQTILRQRRALRQSRGIDDRPDRKHRDGMGRSLEFNFRDPHHGPTHSEPRAHAVGVYSQRNRDTPVTVDVTDTSGPIVLVLSGYSENTWCVRVASDARVDLVLATGYEPQHVIGLPDGVPVFRKHYQSAAPDYACAYGPDAAEWQTMAAAVERWTGAFLCGPLRAPNTICRIPSSLDRSHPNGGCRI